MSEAIPRYIVGFVVLERLERLALAGDSENRVTVRANDLQAEDRQ